MKELTTEQKARRYDEAIEKAKKWYNAPNINKMPTYGNRVIKEIFPELAESEDERIRRFLIKCVNENMFVKSFMADGFDKDEVLAWLEKQGEQKPIKCNEKWYDFVRWFVKERTDDYTLIPSDDDIHKWGDNILNHARKVLDQKPAECKEDVNCRTTGYWVVSPVEERQDNSEIEPLEPWSDDKIINYIITLLRNNNMNNKESKGINESIEIWLKSLKDRYTWKPSDIQLECLSDAIKHYNSLGYPASKLQELLDDLKKLREE